MSSTLSLAEQVNEQLQGKKIRAEQARDRALQEVEITRRLLASSQHELITLKAQFQSAQQQILAAQERVKQYEKMVAVLQADSQKRLKSVKMQEQNLLESKAKQLIELKRTQQRELETLKQQQIQAQSRLQKQVEELKVLNQQLIKKSQQLETNEQRAYVDRNEGYGKARKLEKELAQLRQEHHTLLLEAGVRENRTLVQQTEIKRLEQQLADYKRQLLQSQRDLTLYKEKSLRLSEQVRQQSQVHLMKKTKVTDEEFLSL